MSEYLHPRRVPQPESFYKNIFKPNPKPKPKREQHRKHYPPNPAQNQWQTQLLTKFPSFALKSSTEGPLLLLQFPSTSLYLSQFFHSKFSNFFRLDGSALRIIETLMVSKDVKSSMEVRSSLQEFIRSESTSIIRENKEKPVQKKLLDLDFLVRAFALLGDVEANFLTPLNFPGLKTNKLWIGVSVTLI